ncbi:hypothetical protein G9A89_017974 [Geosiphon pyriformis]|nr:hypothetical protein G9A89_017974 [Geosiphon pyriformis]
MLNVGGVSERRIIIEPDHLIGRSHYIFVRISKRKTANTEDPVCTMRQVRVKIQHAKNKTAKHGSTLLSWARNPFSSLLFT